MLVQNLTQCELADAVEEIVGHPVSEATIRNARDSDRRTNPDVAAAIAARLHVDVDRLFVDAPRSNASRRHTALAELAAEVLPSTGDADGTVSAAC